MRKLERSGLHERVIDEIGRRILSGEYPPGKSLPSEAELCNGMGVSRTALREALRVLAAKGLVEAKPKVGTLVRPTSAWNYLDAQVLSWGLEGRDRNRVISELYELRHLIEPLAASLAAQHAQAAAIEELREAYGDMEAAGNDGAKIAQPDLQFHHAIIAASGNRLFSSLAHIIDAALSVNFELVRDIPRGHAHSMPAHKKVLEAIIDRDPPAARLAMQKLIEDSQRDAQTLTQSSGRRAASAKPRKVARAR